MMNQKEEIKKLQKRIKDDEEILWQCLSWIHYARRANAIDEPKVELELRIRLSNTQPPQVAQPKNKKNETVLYSDYLQQRASSRAGKDALKFSKDSNKELKFLTGPKADMLAGRWYILRTFGCRELTGLIKFEHRNNLVKF